MPLPAVFWAGHSIIAVNVSQGLFLRPALPYTNITQVHRKWCWAAVAQGVRAYYLGNPSPSPLPDQCDIATKTLVFHGTIGQTIDCCNPMVAARHCIIEHQLEPALQVVGHDSGLPLAVNQKRPWPSALFDGEYLSGRVFAIRVDWGSGSGGHFLVIHGYHLDQTSGEEYVDVADPEVPQMNRNLITLWALANAYRVIGTWDHVYLTRP